MHSPISPKPGLAKVLTHEAVYRHLRPGRGPRVICGDLNTPRREHADGSVWTFARDRYGRLRPERGERWDAAERADPRPRAARLPRRVPGAERLRGQGAHLGMAPQGAATASTT